MASSATHWGMHPANPSYTVQPRDVGMYNDGLGLASTIGGSLDLNRSPRLALRISPDWIMTRYGGYGTPSNVPSKFVTRSQNEFGISVGILYRFKMGKGPQVPALGLAVGTPRRSSFLGRSHRVRLEGSRLPFAVFEMLR